MSQSAPTTELSRFTANFFSESGNVRKVEKSNKFKIDSGDSSIMVPKSGRNGMNGIQNKNSNGLRKEINPLISTAEVADIQDDPMEDAEALGVTNGNEHNNQMTDLNGPVADIEMYDGANDDQSLSGENDDDDEEEDFDEERLAALADLEDDDADEEVDRDEDDDEEEDAVPDDTTSGGVPLSPSDIPLIGRTITPSLAPSTIDAATTAQLHPQKPTPYVPDAGHLLIIDPNPIPFDSSSTNGPTESILTATARDAAQALLNHLLTTCPISSVPASTGGSGVIMTLPPPVLRLPREKPVPVPKPPTKWEQFAAKKGIGKNKQEGDGRAGKMVFDDATGEWVPRYGYKGKNKQGENDWLVEIDDKKENKRKAADDAADPRSASRSDRKERVRLNERQMRNNEKRARKGK